MNLRPNRQQGSVLMTTIIIMGVVTILIAALLTVVNRQNYLTARSSTWCSEIPIAEAGIEEALAHLNTGGRTNNGWTLSGTNYVKSRTIGDGYFYTAITTSRPPVIVSIGYGRIPLQTNYTRRTVMVLTEENIPVYGIMAKGTITMGGNTIVDSYDSSDSAQSTGGRYDPTKRSDQAAVGTLSTATNAISGGTIYGYAATGPGGDVVDTTVGDGSFVSTTTGEQAGHVRDDFNATISDVPDPISSSWKPMPATRILSTGDYKLSGDFTGSLLVMGKARFWVTGDVKLKGRSDSITIAPNASLKLYLGGDGDFGGNGIINSSGLAGNCTIYGLNTCTSLQFKGNSSLTAQINAPYADVKFSGTPDLFGSIVGKTIALSGNSNVHYDEALGVENGPAVAIISWEEL